MDADKVACIRKTWAQVIGAPEIVGRLFYSRLFAIAPEARGMFPADMRGQEKKLVDTLDFIVDHLDAFEDLLPVARDLAIRHVAYGTLPDHYPAVGSALVETLEQALGDGFTAEDRAAWIEAYTVLSDEMISAAYPDRAPA